MRKNDASFVVCGHILKLEEEDDNRIEQESMHNCTERIVISGFLAIFERL